MATFDLMEIDLGDGKAGMGQEAGDGLEVVAGFFTEHSSSVAQGVDGDALRVQAGKADVFLEKAADHLCRDWANIRRSLMFAKEFCFAKLQAA